MSNQPLFLLKCKYFEMGHCLYKWVKSAKVRI